MNLRRNLVWLVLMGVLALPPGAAFAKDGDGENSSSGSDDGDRDDGDGRDDNDGDGRDDNDGDGRDDDGDGHHFDNDDDDRDEDSDSLSSSNDVDNRASASNRTSSPENNAINEVRSGNAAPLREVLDIVRKSYGGEIVHVSLSGSGPSLTYGIRLLDKSSKILDLQVNAQSLAISFSPGS
jgi:uncharacterized membrane protein YkoI